MLLLLLAWGIMAPAQAQVLKCQSEHLGKQDEKVEIAADVTFDESGTISVDLFDAGGPAVTFSVSPAEGQPVLDCWGMWVIVT